MRKTAISIVLSLFGALSAPVSALEYDFAYESQGDVGVTPVQIFDDGQRTYFQFRGLSVPPAIFAVTTAGQVVLNPEREGQFLVVRRVERRYLVSLGAAKAHVRYQGHKDRTEAPALFGAAPAYQVNPSLPTPQPAARLQAARAEVAPPSAALPSESPMATPPVTPPAAQAAAPSLRTSEASTVASVADRSPASPAESSSAAPPVPLRWEIERGDQLVSTAVGRWAEKAGWLLFWEAPVDFPAVPVTFSGSFKDAVTALVLAYADSDSPIAAQFADDGTNKSVLIEKFIGNSGGSQRD